MEAEEAHRQTLTDAPGNVRALRNMAELLSCQRRFDESERLFEEYLRLRPSDDSARHDLVGMLANQRKAAQVLPHVLELLQREPHNSQLQILHATALNWLGDSAGAIAVLSGLITGGTTNSEVWITYGNVVRAAGQTEAAV